MAHHVRILREAEFELDVIIAWLAGRSPRGAARLLAAFEKAKDDLAINPFLFGLVPESEFVAFEVRNVFFRTPRGRRYRAIYLIVEEEVRICIFADPAKRSFDL